MPEPLAKPPVVHGRDEPDPAVESRLQHGETTSRDWSLAAAFTEQGIWRASISASDDRKKDDTKNKKTNYV